MGGSQAEADFAASAFFALRNSLFPDGKFNKGGYGIGAKKKIP